MRHTVYLFDGFHLDVTRRKLISSGGLVQPLNSRAMDALLLLVANAGELIEKRRLMQTVWPNAIVEDNNLNQCILAIRKALGETAGSNRYVMTVTGRGYRFVCPVRELVQESAVGRSSAPAGSPRVPRALRWSLLAAACTLALALLVQRLPWDAARPAPAPVGNSLTAAPVSSSIVLRIRAAAHATGGPLATDSALALADCLAMHPESQLRVRVSLVSEQGAPLWTGDFAAGAQDLLSVQTGDIAITRACHEPVAGNRRQRSNASPR